LKLFLIILVYIIEEIFYKIFLKIKINFGIRKIRIIFATEFETITKNK